MTSQAIPSRRIDEVDVVAFDADPCDGGQPFFQLAVEPVLPVSGEQFQQTHDQRSGQPEKGA